MSHRAFISSVGVRMIIECIFSITCSFEFPETVNKFKVWKEGK